MLVLKFAFETLERKSSQYFTLNFKVLCFSLQCAYFVARGTTYVRWSRTHCSGNQTELVYSGKLTML